MRAASRLLGLAAILGGLLAALLLALAAAAFRPQSFLTTRTVSKAIRVFGASYRPRWKSLSFGIRSLDFWTKEISLSAADFCFETVDARAEGCIKSLDARFTIETYLFGARLAKVATLVVAGDHLTVKRAASPPKAGAKAGGPFRLPVLPASLRGAAIETLALDLPANKIVGPGATTIIELHAAAAASSPLSVDATVDHAAAAPPRRARARVSLTSGLLQRGRLLPVDLKGTFSVEALRGGFDARAEQAGPAVSLRIKARGQRRGVRFQAEAAGLQTSAGYALAGAAGVRQSSGFLRSIELSSFKLEAARRAGSWRPESALLDCRFSFEPAPWRREKSPRRPKVISGKLTARARMTPSLLQKDHFDAEAFADLTPHDDWYEFRGGLRAEASGRLSRTAAAALSQEADFTLRVPHFEDIVALLAQTRYAVPAPLHVLKGPISLSMRGRGDPRRDGQEFSYEARSDLSAAKQKLKLRMAGKVAASRLWSKDRSFAIASELALEDAALQAPHLEALSLPALKLDPRIKSLRQKDKERLADEKEAARAVSGSTAPLRLAIHALTVQPAVLYTDLAKTPVPVSFDVSVRTLPRSVEGTISLGPMRMELFRRSAQIDHIRFTRGPGAAESSLDGLVVYQADGAVVRIRLLGTTGKPRVELESEPAMSQQEILALLLYGKSPNDLDLDQQSTVANTRSAMSGKGFSLAYLFLFASTPIQYVGYDPASRSYTMRFRIPGGEILELNSDFADASRVQLSRPLARHLQIRAQARNTSAQGNAVTTLLEWFNRY
jgi:hypothetical protein